MENNLLIIIEGVLIALIICYQIYVGFKLKKDIKIFKDYIPTKTFFKVNHVHIDSELLKVGEYDAIIEYVKNKTFNEKGDVVSEKSINDLDFNLINCGNFSETYFDKIIESLNIYLIRNNGGIADFNIVKDLVERNVSVEEDNLKETINKPLYLGLMATLLGIIFGLFGLYFQIQDQDDNSTIKLDGFLIAVCIAMISSCIGLAITTIIGLNNFKVAKSKVERGKNDFYNFIQTELLPQVSNDFGTSISKLTRSMQAFNADLTSNVGALSNLFQRNYDTLKVQDVILDRLEKINAKDFLAMNATVLKRLEQATSNFDRFNNFVESLNHGLSETRNLSSSLHTLMNRVNNFEGLAEKLDLRVEESNKIIESVDRHFNALDNFEKLNSQMFQRLNENMEDTLGEVTKGIKANYNKVLNQIDDENHILFDAYKEKKTKFDKLDLLDNLEKLNLLEQLSKLDVLFQVKDYIDSYGNHGQELADKVVVIQKLMEDLKIISEQRSKGTQVQPNVDLLSAIREIKNSVEESNNRSVMKKIFGGK